MAMLKNTKHELFAQHVAAGKPANKAYIDSGFAKKGADQGASRLLRNVKVAARVEELKKAVALAVVERTAVDKAWVVKGLVELVERCMQHRPIMKDGKPVTVKVGKGQVAALCTFNAKDALRGYQLLGLEAGMFRDDPRLPPGMNRPMGEEAEGAAPALTLMNQQNNVLVAIGEGGLQAVRAYIRGLRGLDKGPGLSGRPSLPRPD